MSNVFPIGLVGFGKHSRAIWLTSIRSHPEFRLTGISSEYEIPSSPKTPKQSSSSSSFVVQGKSYEVDCPIFNSHEELIQDKSNQILLISSLNSLHSLHVIQALKAGKHVICEKPLCWNEGDIAMISDQMQASSKILCTGFAYRTHPQIREAKNFIDSIGNKDWTIEGHISYKAPEDRPSRLRKRLGGGVTLDAACYLIDICQLLSEKKHRSMKIKRKEHAKHGTSSELELELHYENNCSAYLRSSQNKNYSQKIIIKSKRERFILDSPFIIPKNKKCKLIHAHQVEKHSLLEPYDCSYAQLSLFAESIRENSLMSPLSDGLENAFMLSCITENGRLI